jgi:hypothetical protein
MRVGFEFHEVMSGSYTRTGQPSQTGSFRIDARAHAADLLRHARDGMMTLKGTLDMERIADDVPMTGVLELRPFTRRIIRYDFSFTGNDGQPYRFAGQKDIRLGDLATSFTTLRGAVTDARGEQIATATLRFDVKADLLPFLVSWKPALG